MVDSPPAAGSDAPGAQAQTAAPQAAEHGRHRAGAHLHSIHDDAPVVTRRTGLLLVAGVAVVAALIGGVSGALITANMVGQPNHDAQRLTQPLGSPSEPATPLPGEASAAIVAAAPSVVTLTVSTPTRTETGSAVVYSSDGLVITNAHVVTLDGTVADAQITATMSDGRVYTTSRVGLDVLADVAVLRLDGATGLQEAVFSDSDQLIVGQSAIVLGAPLGLAGTATTGVVSAVNRSIEIASAAVPTTVDENAATDSPLSSTTDPGKSIVQLPVIQTDAAINPGNSGGALLNANGEVIGINVAIAGTKSGGPGQAASTGSIGLGFALPANYAVQIAAQLAAGQTPSHGALGATVRNAATVATSSQSIVGAYVDSVVENGAASLAGLRRGDIVTYIGTIPVANANDLIAHVRVYEAGEEATLTVVRQGEVIEIPVALDAAA
ncbi:S1C family serine protease [Pseudoclavibacter helvolus]|uniref:S1C family serine protease n=1 Tax=Pseudoclavibacter helvolus TaxID=255205 RepID=UPI003C733B05